MKYTILISVLLLFSLGLPLLAATPPDAINYQGVLRDSDDEALDGTYSMIFRFFSEQSGGDEILVDTHGAVGVTGGLFNVQLGHGTVSDGSGPGTYSSLSRALANYPDMFLEVEVGGERLSPRVQLVSAAYSLNTRYVRGMELVSTGPLDLYVDGINGDDANDGLDPGTAKKTIQAAADAVPVVLTDNVTIHIADGTYHEEVRIGQNVVVCREAEFCILTLAGNPTVPSNVTLDGQASLQEGINVGGNFFVRISGVRIVGFTGDGVHIAPGMTVGLEYCEIDGNGGDGVHAFGAYVFLDNVSVSNSTNYGMFLSRSYGEMEANISFTNNGVGIYCDAHCHVDFESTPTMTGNTGGDMHARNFSIIHRYVNGALSCTTSGVFSACQP